MRSILGVLLLLVSCSAFAGPEAWMIQTKPDSLGMFVEASINCPFKRDDLKKVVEGEYLRARIKPTESFVLNMTVNVDCMLAYNKKDEEIGHVVGYEIRYGAQLPTGEFVLYESPNYGDLMISTERDYFLNQIKDKVAESITDYLKANVE